MADKLGITVEFKGKTTEFENAVKQVNNEIKATKSEIGTLNKQLKLDPSNVELLQRKFNALNDKQRELNDKVKLYQDALSKMDSSQIGSKEWTDLTIKLNKAKAELAQLNDELEKMPTAKIQSLAKQLEETEAKLNKVGNAVENIGKKFMVLTGAITGLATVGVKYNAELERQTALFTTLTGSAEEAEKTLRAIKDDALGSPFDTQSLISANQYLLSTGMEAEKSRKTIMALGNAISATGGGNSELQRMAQNLQQIQNVGKATSMDIRQFAMAGIDIYGILAESTGKTVAQIQEMDITFDMINNALIKASQEGGKYFGAMEAQSETLNGKLNMLKATFQELMGELTQVLMPVIKSIIDIMQSMINYIKNLDDEQKQAISKIALLVASIGPILVVIGKVVLAISSLSEKIRLLITSKGFVAWIAKVQSAGGGLAGVFKTLTTVLSKFINPVTAIIGLFALLFAKHKEFRDAVLELVQTLAEVFKPQLDIIKGAISLVVDIFNAVATVIRNVVVSAFNILGNVLASVIKVITNLVKWLSEKLKPAIDLISEVVKWLKNDFDKLVTVIKDNAMVVFGDFKLMIDDVKDKIRVLIDWVKELWKKFSDTTAGQIFITLFEKIGGIVSKVAQWVSNLVGDMTEAVRKANDLASVNSRATRYNGSQFTQTQDVMNSGGIGLGGITANINVTNNGTPIDEAEISRWVDSIARQVDQELGRRL